MTHDQLVTPDYDRVWCLGRGEQCDDAHIADAEADARVCWQRVRQREVESRGDDRVQRSCKLVRCDERVPELVLVRVDNGRIQFACAEKQGFQHDVRGGATVAGRRRTCEVNARGNEPCAKRCVRDSRQEPPRRRSEGE